MVQIPFRAYPQTWSCGSSFTDSRDNTVYNTVLIGNQCWLKQNLNYGTRINGNQNQVNKKNPQKYCYNDLSSNCNIYGGLYQWGQIVLFYNGASDSTMWSPTPSVNIQGICPSGWLLPTDQDWCNFATYIDSTVNCTTLGSTGTDAGGKLKEVENSHWTKPNTGATDYYHFTGLPSGGRDTSTTFSGLSYQTGF